MPLGRNMMTTMSTMAYTSMGYWNTPCTAAGSAVTQAPFLIW